MTHVSNRGGWHEPLGTGIRRDHRAGCQSSTDRKPNRECGCPLSWWQPNADGSRSRVKFTDGSLAEAKKLKKSQETERDRAKQQSALDRHLKPTLQDWAKTCLREWEGTIKTSSFSNYRNAYETRIHGHFGAHRVDEITPPMVSDWIHDLIATEGNTGSVHKAYQTLRRMMNMARRQQHVIYNPVEAVAYPKRTMRKAVRSRDRVLTLEQYLRLLDACVNPQHRLLIRCATETGARRGELAGVQFSDLGRTAKGKPCLHLQRSVSQNKATNGQKLIDKPKSGRDRKLALTEDLLAEFERFFQWQQAAVGATRSSFVWAGKVGRTGKLDNSVPAAPHSLADMLERRLLEAGLVDERDKPLTTLHGLRATSATLAAEAGVNPFVIQHQLGHAELRTTQESYLGAPDPDMLAEYAEVFR